MTTVSVRDATLLFPRKRAYMGPIGKSLVKMLPFMTNREEEYFPALSDVTVEVSEGEVVGLVGRNGAGKSTLLRVMAGIYRPTKGIAQVAGDPLLLAGLSVGFNVNLTGRENAYLYGTILGMDRATLDAAMPDILEFCGLGQFFDEPLRTYSSGMRSRLGFSVAIHVSPDILLIDEVLAVGDAAFRSKSTEKIKEVVLDAKTVVVASHNLKMLEELCTRGVLVEDGRVLADGDIKEVVAEYREVIKRPRKDR